MSSSPRRLVGSCPEDWQQALGSLLATAGWQAWEKRLQAEYATTAIYPPPSCLWAALQHCPLEQVKVVILGQDPYIHAGEAMGLAFSVPRGVKFPRSLVNLFKELQRDLGVAWPSTGDLTKWAQQGVLLLNTVLTVRAGQSNSHQGQGWEALTREMLRQVQMRQPHVVFLLWGSQARAYGAGLDRTRHTVLETSHPSPLSVNKGFSGCSHFSQCNAALQAHGQAPIEWTLETE